uniref:CSON007691 protein n=1 Tax=Culicoides sonorensis TaxID=179676 RepID=A0A336MZT0_CULSO
MNRTIFIFSCSVFLILCFYVTKLTSFRFPTSTVCGILLAIAVPLDLPRYNVFVSYNFEANYNVPTTAADITKGPLLLRTKRLLNDTGEGNFTNEIENLIDEKLNTNEIKKTSFITRQRIYEWIESKLNVNAINGKECLLRAICEYSNSSFSKHNGFLGDLFHIVLSPHTSKKEPNLDKYYEAETRGITVGCIQYVSKCDTDILNFMSMSF